MQHSTKQNEYLKQKAEIAKALGFRVRLDNIKCTQSRIFPATRLVIKLGKDLTNHYKQEFYPNGKKTISYSILNKLDLPGIAIWYQDDGSLCHYKHRPYIKWSTHAFTIEEHKLITSYFQNRWNIRFSIRLEKGKYYFIRCGKTEGKKFTALIDDLVHTSMKYKVEW